MKSLIFRIKKKNLQINQKIKRKVKKRKPTTLKITTTIVRHI